MIGPDTTSVLDEYLVVQCQLGDEKSFRLLVERWHRPFLRYALHTLRDPDAARDVVQESWIGILRGLRGLHDATRFQSWAYRIVSNKARDWIRRERSRRHATRRFEAAELATPPAFEPGGGTPEALERVRAGLVELDAERRAILTSYYLEGKSIVAIANALSIPAGTVKSRLFAAREALRRRLEEDR